MGDLLIGDISDAIKRNIAVGAERRDGSLSDEAKRLMPKGMIAEESVANDYDLTAWDSLRSILGPENDDEAEDFAKIIDEIERTESVISADLSRTSSDRP
jgi:plasmid stability protein